MNKSGFLRGFSFILSGLVLLYWAESHSSLKYLHFIGVKLKGEYVIPENLYILLFSLSIILIIIGLVRSFRSMKKRAH